MGRILPFLLRLKPECRILTQVHPVLLPIGSLLIPSYGVLSALGVLLALCLAQRTANGLRDLNAAQVWNLSVISLFAALVGQRLRTGRRQLE